MKYLKLLLCNPITFLWVISYAFHLTSKSDWWVFPLLVTAVFGFFISVFLTISVLEE